jgi:hypothetical protein
MRNTLKRVLRGAAALAGAAALSIGLALPSQAAIPADGVVADGEGFLVTKSTTDAGGVKYTIQVDWSHKYTYQGKTRVSVPRATVYRSDANVLAHGSPEDAGVDLFLRVYSSNTLIQNKVWDGIDLDAGADNQVSVNPANPVSNADIVGVADAYSSVRIKVGTDSDGLGNSPWVVFAQPSGIQFQAA